MKSFEFESKIKRRPVVYVDMDGVLADFFGEVASQHNVEYWREIHRKDLGIDQLAKEPGFFANLEPMPNSGRLIKAVLTLAGKYSILSSPLMSNVEQSSEEKADWLRTHLGRHPPTGIIFDHDKAKFAKQADGTPNILIDDYETNIKLWCAAGGIGIHYDDDNIDQVIKELKLALNGKLKPDAPELAVLEDEDVDTSIKGEGKLYTSRQVLKYVTGIHHEYHMPKPILKHKTWVLKQIPVSNLNTPEYVHQDDPYRRVIDIDWDHVKDIHMQDIKTRPIVVDEDGWVLDGNHRAVAARARGLSTIPALVPYK
jgi:5'(3')-deoxyribonucleotidase